MFSGNWSINIKALKMYVINITKIRKGPIYEKRVKWFHYHL
jgi:hypothetical protein